ncbi:MAG: PaaI family thioesterase [Pseudomonadota bacterium]
MPEKPESGPIGLSAEAINQWIKRSPFNSFLGVHVNYCHDGALELTFPIRPELRQFHGFAHGAVVAAVADVSCAWAAAHMVGNVRTAEYKINFLAPAEGDRLIGRSQVIKVSKRQVICRSDVYAVKDDQEKLVATALATIMPVE